MAKSSGGLSRWFKEEWVDLSRPKKGGGFEPCGRPDADEGKYPKCVPKAKAMKMTQAEIDSAVRRKRRAESTEERKGKKPINVPTEVEKKSKNIPSNPKLYAKVKAEARRKFDVYPSAYANGWLVQEYKRRGGTYKTVTKQQPDSSEVHVPSTNWKFKRKKKRGLSSLVDKHADHDQKSHGSWADARSGQPDRPEGLGTYRPPAEFDDRIGRCYELSWRTVSKMPERGRLVHGSIQGAGNERIPHSWTEVDDLAYDPVMDEWFPADFYRSLVNAEVAEEYTKDEVNMIVRREMNMGPWHKEPYGTQWYEERGL